MKWIVVLVVVTCAVLGWMFLFQTKAIEPKPTAIEPKREEAKKTPWDGYDKWYHLTEGRPITGDPTGYLGSKEGEKGYREVYVNAVGEAVSKGKAPYVYPEGTILLREVYSDKSAWETKKTPALLISMKLRKGSAPESKDWEYVLIPPGEAEQRGKGDSKTAQFCTTCHLNAGVSNDWHFTNASFFEKLKN